MKKPLLLLPIMLSLPFVGLSSKENAYKVSADGPTYMRYFLMDENQNYGLSVGGTQLNIDNTTGVTSAAALNNPIYVETVSANTYRISIVANETRFYAVAKATGENTYFNSDISQASSWNLFPLGGDQYEITSGGRYLGFYYYSTGGTTVMRFGTTDDKTAKRYTYSLTLINIDDAVSDFVTAMSDIDCSTYNPSSSDWNNAKDAFDALPVPVKNYLQTLKCNPDASHSTIEWALSKYDYIVYRHHERLTPFIEDREIKDPTSGNVINYNSNVIESNGLTAIITVVSLITVASVTSLLFFKRKSK